MNVNSKLKGLRVELGYTQMEVADAIGITVGTYCRKEKGINEFCKWEIDELIQLFGRPYDDLFGEPRGKVRLATP